jgi:hypothetical protein
MHGARCTEQAGEVKTNDKRELDIYKSIYAPNHFYLSNYVRCTLVNLFQLRAEARGIYFLFFY